MQKTLQTSYGAIAVNDNAKHAPALVFIHANSYSKEAFSRQFDSAALSQYRLIALDLPGHGASEDAKQPEACYCMRHYAQMLREVLSQLDVRPLLLFGWSLGGHIAIEACAQGLEAGGLMICGTPPIGPGVVDLEQAFLPSEHMALTGKAVFTDAEAALYAEAALGTLDFVDQVKRCDGRAREQMLTDWTAPEAGHNAVAFISSWPKTIAVLHGADEPFISLAYLQNLPWANLWRGQVHVINAAGHAPFWQQADEVNALLRDFAADCAGA